MSCSKDLSTQESWLASPVLPPEATNLLTSAAVHCPGADPGVTDGPPPLEQAVTVRAAAARASGPASSSRVPRALWFLPCVRGHCDPAGFPHDWQKLSP